jgi:MinD superfamily P-loop ATPase
MRSREGMYDSAKDQIEAGAVARVNPDLCTKCGICETNGSYAAIAKDPRLARLM